MSIKKLFLIEEDKNPLLSSCVNFKRAVKKQGFSSSDIRQWFDKLVKKNDYEYKDKKEVVEFLITYTSHNK